MNSRISTANSNNFLLRTITVFAVIGCVALALAPLLFSGYYSDDLMNSTIRGRIALEGQSLSAHLLEVIRHWAVDNGRVFPVAILTTIPFSYYLVDITAHKAAILFLVTVDLLLYFKLLEQLTKDFHAACLGVLLLPLLLQFRLYHDPLLSFSGLMPLFLGLTLLSLITFQLYLTSNRWRHLVMSLIAYNLTLYFYEISLPLVVLFPALAARGLRPQQILAALRKATPFLVALSLAVVVNLLARTLKGSAAAGYDGIALSHDIRATASTLANQIFASLPLSYLIADPSNLFRETKNLPFSFLIITPVIMFAAIYWQLTAKITTTNHRKLPLIGIILLLLPALLISLSIKYQNESRLGLGYVQNYIQCFGLALIILWLLLVLHHHAGPKLLYLSRVLICVGLSLCLLRTIQDNWIVVTKANIDSHYRRAALVAALEAGILSGLPDQAILLIVDSYTYDPLPKVKSPIRDWAERGYPWKDAGFVYQYSGKKLRVAIDPADLAKLLADSADHGDMSHAPYALTIHSRPQEAQRAEAYVVLSRIENLSTSAAGTVQYRTIAVRAVPP
jgi:hypothetical protein